MWLVISAVLVVVPWLPHVQAMISPTAAFIVSGAGLALLLCSATVAVITRLYIRAAANEAFVRTGMGGTKVILDGGTLLIPVVHQLIQVPLTTMRLDVDRSGPDSLITADKLRADLKAEFYIRVMPQAEDIKNAARSLGDSAGQPQRIAGLVNDKLISALRSVAANKTLEELNTRRNEFAAEVKSQVEADLKHNGLTLETVTISKLDQTDPKNLKADNVFDAQGLKRITEITTEAAVRRNELEQAAQQSMKEKNVETRQRILALELQQADAEASQASEVAKVRSLRESESRQAQIEQEQRVQQREVERLRAIKASEIEAQQRIIESERARELTEVERGRDIETAHQNKAMTIAQAQAKRADAEQEQFVKMALREKAMQEVETVKVTATAEREAAQKLIAASRAAEQEMVREQRRADGAAYTVLKEAEAKKAAAQAEYEASLKAAEALSEAAIKRAEGETAEQMVAVTVAQRLVQVEQEKVEVESRRLESQERFGKAAIELQVRLKEIEANVKIEVARSEALGQMLSRGNFTIYGDPTTFSKMADSFNKGVSVRQMLEGFVTAKPENSALSQILQQLVAATTKKADGPHAATVDASLHPALSKPLVKPIVEPAPVNGPAALTPELQPAKKK